MGKTPFQNIEQLSPQDRANLEEKYAEQIDWDPEWQLLRKNIQKTGGKPITNRELIRNFFQVLYGDASAE